MLTDEEIETAMSGKELPMDYYELKQFARDIERAVMAKAMQKQEPVAYLPFLSNRADGVDGHYAIGRYNPSGYYEYWNLRSHKWSSCSDDVLTIEQATELLHKVEIPTNPQPAQAEAIPEKLQDIEIPKAPANGENPYIWITQQEYVRGWNDCREAMLSASPKPE